MDLKFAKIKPSAPDGEQRAVTYIRSLSRNHSNQDRMAGQSRDKHAREAGQRAQVAACDRTSM